MARVENVSELLNNPQHGQILLAADIHARKKAPLKRPLKAALPYSATRVFASRDQPVFQKFGVIVGRDALVFLVERLFIGRTVFDEVEVLRFIHFLLLSIGGQRLLQLEQKALVQRVLQGDTVQADALGVAPVPGLAHQLVKEAVRATVRADQLHAAAPGDTGVGNRPHLALLPVQSELVQHAAAALACLSVWVARHAVNAPPAGELQHIGADLLFCV